ncbi:TPA: winged helix-turn-helix domain-containing protein [Escherichia coli]|nr:winged helix-turn-helix domain-containing protein [Escherichia coli]
MTSYILNEDVEFIYEDNRLTSLKNDEISVTLTTPSSKCLYLLIENSPHVVSHDELLRRVWEDNGMIVPVNTLHQSISIIRRGLNKVRPDGGSLVKNIPGQGFRFTGVVTGNLKDNKDNKELHAVPVMGSGTFSAKYKRFIQRATVTGIALLGFVSTACIYWTLSQGAYALNLHNDYLFETSPDGCSVYSNARVKYDIQKKNEIHRDINGSGLTCTDYPMEYISTYTASSVSSAIKCKVSIYKKARDNCISFYYRDGV